MTSGINYEDLELRALAHTRVWLYDNSPRVKPRQAAYHFPVTRSGVLTSEPAHHWDPAPPLRMGPQRCLSSRETIERLAFVLPKPRPSLTPKEIGEYLSAWWSKYPVAREYFPERVKPRTVWMGGDYIDDGTGRPPTPEEAAERWRQVREVIVEASKRYPMDPESARLLREETLYGSQTYYPPHTRDRGARG